MCDSSALCEEFVLGNARRVQGSSLRAGCEAIQQRTQALLLDCHAHPALATTAHGSVKVQVEYHVTNLQQLNQTKRTL